MNNRKRILAVFLLTTAIVLVIMLVVKSKKTPENKELSDIEGIEPGEYFSVYPVGLVRIDKKGTATYYPDLISNQSYEDICSIDNNVLTLNSGDKYWKFKIINEQLQLIEEKTYGGVIDC